MKIHTVMPWGKYKNQRMSDVPTSYLIWCLDEGYLRDDLCEIAKEIVAERLGIACVSKRDVENLEILVASLRERVNRAEARYASIEALNWTMKSKMDDVKDTVYSSYRTLAKIVHPDKFGSDDAMKILNSLRDTMQKMF